MIKITCDECGKERPYNPDKPLPDSWVVMIIGLPSGRVKEGHFCSWECLAEQRKRQAKKRAS